MRIMILTIEPGTGREVILDRREYCDYFARATLRGLAAQYQRYGRWKAEMIRLNPVRSGPSFGGPGICCCRWCFWERWAPPGDEPGGHSSQYLLARLLAGVQATIRTKASPFMLLLMPLVFATIHLTWGGSFLAQFSVCVGATARPSCKEFGIEHQPAAETQTARCHGVREESWER